MLVRIFHKFSESLTSPKKIEKPLVESIRDKLEELKKAIAGEKDDLKKKDLQRQIARLERFNDLQEGKTSPEGKDSIQTILKGKSSENYLGSDLLSLKRHGVDIASLVLTSEKNPELNISSSNINISESFIVNFGVNKHLNANIGAGDILSPEINKITVNGIEGIRKDSPQGGHYSRPGYYSGTKYLPIFDGDKIEIVSKGSLSDEENKSALVAGENRWKKLRMNDMEDYNEGKSISDLQDDQSLFAELQEKNKNKLERRNKFNNYNPENKIKFMESFGDIVKRECSLYGIPESILVDNLFAKENARFDPKIKNPYSSAHGLGQILTSTWRFIESLIGEDLDRYNPEDQIRATAKYLSYIKDLKNCTWGDAVVYYHTGPGFNNSNVQQAMAVNTPIVAHMENISNPTAQDYINGAKKYYGIDTLA